MTRLFVLGLSMLLALSFATSEAWSQSLPLDATSAKSQTRTGLSNDARTTNTASKVPLEFEANHGQAPAQFDFVAHGESYVVGISGTEIALTISRRAPAGKARPSRPALDLSAGNRLDLLEHAQLNLRLLGANTKSKTEGLQPTAGVSNYFIGNDPTKWHTNVPHYGQVERSDVYPGIDLVFYGNPQQLEYDFRVNAGANPRMIRLAAAGASAVSLDADGNLVFTTAAGNVQLKRPSAYQEIDGSRRTVPSHFRVEADRTILLEVGGYDHGRALIIDPVLTYAAAFGGTDGNQALGMDVDAAGNVYLTGNSCSSDFPTTAGAFQTQTTNPAILACQEAFALKLDPTASRLIYSDYFGGTGASTGTHVAVDAAGDLFVTGATTSPDFPLSGNTGPSAPQSCPLFQAPQLCPEGFVLKLSPDGSSMAFSTLLGGSQATVGFQLKLNPVTGDVVVLGNTNSLNFMPAMTGPQTTYEGGTCDNLTYCLSGFLVGLDPASGVLRYGTFLGGTGSNFDAGLAFDTLGNIYVAGSTVPPLSTSLGNVTHTYPPAGGAAAGGMDIFVTRLNLNQSKLSVGYLTLIQGESDDIPSGLAVDSNGNAYLTGSTASKSLPVSAGAYQSSTNSTNFYGCLWNLGYPTVSCGTIFVGKVDPTGAISFLTYLGGSITDWGEAIALDSLGNIWLTGATSSSDFPFTPGAYGISTCCYTSPLLAEMTNNGATLSFASPVAGIFGRATDLRIDGNNNVYLTGYAYTAPTTPATYSDSPSPLFPEANPLFVQKWGSGPAPVMTVSATALNLGPTLIGSTSPPQTVTLANTGAGPLELGIQTVSDLMTGGASPFKETDNCGTMLAANSSCTLTVSLEPSPFPPDCTIANGCDPQTPSATIVILNNAPSGTQKIALSGSSGTGPSVSIVPNTLSFLPQIAGTPSPAQYVQISNLGDINLALGSVAISGLDAADFQLTNGCPAQIAAGNFTQNFCQLTIVFSPAASATGTRTAALDLVDNAPGSPQSIPLTGSVATASAALNVSPMTLNLGSTQIGSGTYQPNGIDFNLTNTSATVLIQVTGITIGGTNAADFLIDPNQAAGRLPFTLAPGAQVSGSFYFAPSSGPDGPRTATATLITNPSIPGLPILQLQGVAATSTDPALSIYTNPSPLDLGSVQVGQSSGPSSTFLQISNGGPSCGTGGATSCGGPLVVSSIVSGLGDFTLVPYSTSVPNCVSFPMTIPLSSSCGFNIIFTPAAAGLRSTMLTINSNDPGGPVTIPVTGTGLALPIGALTATALNFGYAAIGVASPPLTVNLQNTSTVPLTISTVTASANYDVASNTCSTAVTPGASCTIGVNFTPPTAGAFSGTLTISDNNELGGQQSVALTGIGATGPSLMILPNAINFGTQVINTISTSQTATLTNFGDTVISFPANAFLASPEFVVSGTTCGATLALQASCTVDVEFEGSAVSVQAGTLTVTDGARGSPQQVYLTGVSLYPTTTTVTSSVNPSPVGQVITFTASVAKTPATYFLPTGNVTFYDGNVVLGIVGVGLNGNEQATFTTSSLSAGAHAITAVYGSDVNFISSTSAVLNQVVGSTNQVPATTTLSSSLNPATATQSVTFSATVAGTTSNSPLPTGTVTFYDGSSMIGSSPLNGSAQANFTTAVLSDGSHSITAVYGSDSNYAGSTSAILTEVVNAPPQVGTTTTIASSLNPAAASQSIVFTAAVAGTTSNSPLPVGAVVFYDGSTVLGSGTLNGNAQATFTTSTLAPGSHSIIAEYGSSPRYATSTSPTLTQVINAPAKLNSVTTLASSNNPSQAGVSISFTATVTGAASNTPVPTGSVSFLDGTTVLGSGMLNGSGVASFSTNTLAQGTHTITAQYAGDSNYLGSLSGSISQIVFAAPSFTLSLSPTTLTLAPGQSGNSTLTLTSAGGFNQSVSFACSGLPKYATCTFSPASVIAAANANITSTLTIATNVNNAALRRDSRGSGQDKIYMALLGFGLVALLRKKRKGVAKLPGYGALILLLSLLGFVAMNALGCGGGTPDITPSGSGSVTVTASAGALQQSQTLTLTIQ